MNHVRVLIWALGFLMLAFTVTAVRFGPERVTRWRVNQLLTQARQAVDQAAWPEAARLAKAAHQLQLGNLDAVRIARDSLQQAGDSEALRYAELAASSPIATPPERFLLVEWLLQVRRLEDAARWIDKLEGDPAEIDYLKALQLAYSDHRSEAIALLRQHPQPKHALLLGDLLLHASLPAAKAEGVALLLQILQEPSNLQQQALFLLSDAPIPPDSFSQIRPFAEILSEEARTRTAAGYLAWQSLEIYRDPESLATRIEATTKRFRESDLDTLLPWLIRHDQNEVVLNLVSKETSRESLPRYESYLSALLRTDQLTAVEELLNQPVQGFPEVQALAIRATLARLNGNLETAPLLWKKALYLADNDSSGRTATLLGILAQNAGEPTVALQAMRMAIHRPAANNFTSTQYAQTLPFFYQRSNENDVLAITELAKAKDPDNPDTINNFAYLRLLEGLDVDNAIGELEDLVTQYPEKITYKASLALGYLKSKQPEKSAALLKDFESTWESLEPGDRAVMAATLMQSGQQELASTIAASLANATLLPKERALLDAIP